MQFSSLQPQGKFQAGTFQQIPVCKDFLCRTCLDDPALIQQDDPVTSVPDEIQVMGSDQLRTRQMPQDLDQFAPVPGIQRRRWFIQQQQIGALGQDPGNGRQFFLTAGEPLNLPLCQFFHSHLGQRIQRAPLHFFLGISGIAQRKGHVTLHGGHEQLAF